MIPPKRITDPSFVYTSSVNTDIRKRFQAERERIAAERRDAQCRAFNVTPLKLKEKK